MDFNSLKLKNKFLYFSDIEEDNINFLENPNKVPKYYPLEIDIDFLIKNSQSDQYTEIKENQIDSNEKDDLFDEMNELRKEREKFSNPTEKVILENDAHIIFTNLELKEYYGEKEYEYDNFFLSKNNLNYRLLLPENRFRYLNWLLDISKEIEVKYLVLYLTCLERNMLNGNLDEIIDEILFLRKYHSFTTFINKSENSINLLCYYRSRLDILYELYLKNEIKYSVFILIYQVENNIELSALDLQNLMKLLSFKLTKYKNKEEEYLKKIEQYLLTKFGKSFFPLNIFEFNNNSPINDKMVNNLNLFHEIGYISYPELYYNENFNIELNLLYNSTY